MAPQPQSQTPSSPYICTLQVPAADHFGPLHAARMPSSAVQKSQVAVLQPGVVQLNRPRTRQYGSGRPQPQSHSAFTQAGSFMFPQVQPFASPGGSQI